MKTNIKGLVDRLELSPTKAMMPLFEAISNAIDAIGDLRDGMKGHEIRIRLISLKDLAYKGNDEALVIDGFDVTDDGIGFDDAHLESFKEAHTLSKVVIGGRGVGRFTLLKVFSNVHVESTFVQDGTKLKRIFDFNIDEEVKGGNNATSSLEPRGTVLSVRQMNPKFRAGWPQDPNIIAERIIAHFLIRFAARSIPTILLEWDGGAPKNLGAIFTSTVLPHIKEQSFEVMGHTFSLQAYRQRDGRTRHDLHLCANGREVTTTKLRDLLPELPEKLLDQDQHPHTLIVLVTGEYFDMKANSVRTRIPFLQDDEIDLDDTLVSRQALNRGIAETLRPLLADDLSQTQEEKRQQIEKFVEDAPEYRALTHPRYRQLIDQRIQPGLTKDKLDEALLHLKREVEDSVQREVRHVAAKFDTQSFEQYEEQLQKVAAQVNELGKSELAKYVTRRRTILDLVRKSLTKSRSDAKYPLERVLHKMIFPMGVTSQDIFFEQQNLWMIDERLCYHTLLTSDKKLNSIVGMSKTSGKEPDIFAFFYDTPTGVAEADNLPGGGIVIIEFKRPGRDDYDKDPADQIIQRFREISEGEVKDINGRPINPTSIRFTGYLIADLEPSLRRNVFGRYHRTADNEGYFQNLSTGNGSIEILSYDKLIKDAERRNRILFAKLFLHKG